MKPRKIRAATARRIALAAQGFGRRREDRPPTTRQITNLVRRLGVLQLDSVNVFCRAHYMPVFSRLGPYDRNALDRIAGHHGKGAGRTLIEYWAHEASLIPVELHPLFRWRMAEVDDHAWGGIVRINREQPGLVADTLELVRREGPIRAGATGHVRPAPETGRMWNWHDGKIALEYLFFGGRIVSPGRVNFERLYDIPERVVPATVRDLPDPDPAEAQRELVRISARALGIATEPDLGDYFRLPRAASKARVAELADAGELLRVEVDGWGVPAYLWHEARRPRQIEARALLSPFDPLVWFRSRAERLFGFTYRIEIYTPAQKRVYGYYVLPFLLGDRLVARVDLKSDRQARVLRVQGAFAEDGVDIDHIAVELAAELATVAGWLGLDDVAVQPKGNLALALAGASASHPVRGFQSSTRNSSA
jgi:uncharacterized protein